MASISRDYLIENPSSIKIANHKDLKFFNDSGKNGLIFIAKSEYLHRDHAIKIFVREDGKNINDRFLEEINKIASLKHPNIVTIHQASKLTFDDGSVLPYAIYEFIKGINLNDWLSRNPSFDERMEVVSQLTETIQYFHKKNIYHGDLHGGNIIISQIENKLKITVIDFSTSLFVKNSKRNPAIRENKCMVKTFLSLFTSSEITDSFELTILNNIKPKCLPFIFKHLKKLSIYLDLYRERIDEFYNKMAILFQIAIFTAEYPVFSLQKIRNYLTSINIDIAIFNTNLYSQIIANRDSLSSISIPLDGYDGTSNFTVDEIYHEWQEIYQSRHNIENI